MASALQGASGHTCSDRYAYQPFLFDPCYLFVLYVVVYSELFLGREARQQAMTMSHMVRLRFSRSFRGGISL